MKGLNYILTDEQTKNKSKNSNKIKRKESVKNILFKLANLEEQYWQMGSVEVHWNKKAWKEALEGEGLVAHPNSRKAYLLNKIICYDGE